MYRSNDPSIDNTLNLIDNSLLQMRASANRLIIAANVNRVLMLPKLKEYYKYKVRKSEFFCKRHPDPKGQDRIMYLKIKEERRLALNSLMMTYSKIRNSPLFY